jgi:glycosyltransferase involved in cell wall biosynthesis
MSNKSLMFIGGFIPSSIEDYYIKRNHRNFPYAANSFQEKLIFGLSKYFSLTILSKPFIGSFPKDSKIFINKPLKVFFNGVESFKILSFFNLPILKYFILPFEFKKSICEYIANNKNKRRYYFIYSFGLDTYFYLKEIKKLDKNSKIILSIHDLPEFIMMSVKNKFKRNLVVDLLYSFMKKSEPYIDGIMTVSKYMLKYLKQKNIFKTIHKNVVLEALVSLNSISKFNSVNSQKSIFYSGGLFKEYGLKDLIDAFRMIDYKNIKLVITGDGPLRNEIISLSLIDKRISYLGVLKNKDVMKLQNESSILVNPRKSSAGDFTRYSFPIKTIEYLSTGKPVIAYKLDGIPKEYFKHFIVPNDESVIELKETIIRVLDYDRVALDRIHSNNTRFVNNNKTSIIQCKKLVLMYEAF